MSLSPFDTLLASFPGATMERLVFRHPIFERDSLAVTDDMLDKMIEVVSKTLVWPFEGTTVYRLTATVISPFVLVLFEVVTNIASSVVAGS